MATHDYVIANASGAAVRQDINNALAAIVSNNSSATEPGTTYAFQFWFDTTNNILKIRNAANSAWIDWITTTATVLLPDGTGGSPSLTFAAETDTGLLRNAANSLAIATSGTQRVEISDTGIIINDVGDDTDVRIEGANEANLVFIDAGNDRVGIGEAAPDQRLHVKTSSDDVAKLESTSGGNGPNLTFTHTGASPADDDTVGKLTFAATNDNSEEITFADIKVISTDVSDGSEDADFTFSTRNDGTFAERMRLDSSGRLGIGFSAEQAPLEVQGQNAFGSSASTLATATTKAAFRVKGSNNSSDSLWMGTVTTNAEPYIQGANGVGSASKDLLLNPFGGDVGIGTTSPGFPLHVKNAGSSACRFVLENSGSGSNDSTQIYSQNNDLAFVANDSDAMRIDSSQRVLIGTTSNFVRGNLQVVDGGGGEILIARNDTSVDAGDDIGHIFFGSNDSPSGAVACASITCLAAITHATGSSPTHLTFSTTATGSNTATERMRIENDGFKRLHSNESGVLIGSAASAGTTHTFLTAAPSQTSITTGATTTFKVFTNGNVQNTNNSYGAISDAKLKENIVDASSQWDNIKDLRVRNYNFIEGQTHTQIGVVAQEVETVSPGLVTESPDRDEEGNDLGTVTKSVNYSVLYMKAVKALQEAMDRIEILEAKVAALEAG